jgi:hypothetical protein
MRLIALFFLLATNCFARERITEFKSPEALGRGNVTASWSNSLLTNLFYNPSFLSNQQDFSFQLVHLVSDFSDNSFSLLKKFPEVQSGDSYGSLKSYFGNSYQVQSFGSPVFSYKGFALIPVFINWLGSATVRNPVFSSANAFYYYDVGSAIGKGLDLNENLSIGFSILYIKRKAILDSASLDNVLKLPKPKEERGKTISFNAGFNYKIKDESNTTIGLSLLNIGSPRFWSISGKDPNTETVSKLNESLNLGISSYFFPLSYFEKKVKWAIEINGLATNIDNYFKKVNIGIKYSPYSWVAFDSGIYQQSPTFGIEFFNKIIALDLSTYLEPTDIGYQTKNRHYIFGLRLGLN